MKQDYTMHIYKADHRYKSGERPVSRTIWTDRTEEGMVRECAELANLYPAAQGYRFEYYPAMKTVKSLMSGKDVRIDTDTPWCCNPASETYWSM